MAASSPPGSSRLRIDPRDLGFTLIDVLAAVAVVGALVAIALPAWREQIARARRMDVQAALLEDAGYMQRYYAANNGYGGTPSPRLTAPASPRTGAPSYRISVSVLPDRPDTYVLTAARAGGMAGDKCGDFTYDNLGVKGLVPGTFGAGQSAASCWR
jgi:type IV pilus assembly protein PilE